MKNLFNESLDSFIDEFVTIINIKKMLLFNNTQFEIFKVFPKIDVEEIQSLEKAIANEKYKLILGLLPLGLNTKEIEVNNKKLKIHNNWINIPYLLDLLDFEGYGVFLVEPLGFSTKQGIIFETELNNLGYYVNAYLNIPDGALYPYTSITPILVIISRKETNKLFVAEIDDSNQARYIARNYLLGKDEDGIKSTKYISKDEFKGFKRLKVKDQIDRLETQYKSYEKHTLDELAIDIRCIREGDAVERIDNSIYIPRIGNSDVIVDIDKAKLKHHNYFQVNLKNIVSSDYMEIYFKSTLGKLILSSLATDTFISHLNIKDIKEAVVSIPSISEQLLIVNTNKMLEALKESISNIEYELALNPKSSDTIKTQIEKMLDAIGALSEADKVRSLIREGESKYLELKETLSLDVRKQTKEKYIELEALKTVTAFLNSDGGILIIGVNDEGEITGIEKEVYKFYINLDKFLLHWKNLLNSRIGAEFYPFIEPRLIKIDNVHVLEVDCKQSKSPCYLDDTDFYVRTNPATDKLEGPKLVDYVKNHFQ